MSDLSSNRLVFFGATGDLAFKQIFPALQALTRRGRLDMPVIGIARSDWSDDKLREHARESIEKNDKLDPAAFTTLAGNLSYLRGDYGDEGTFQRLKKALGEDARPLFYLAIPPDSFEEVVKQLGRSGAIKNARVVLEKPFGHDLQSARELEKMLLDVLPDSSIFRIDHFLGKEPVQNLTYFRFANSFVEDLWNKDHIQSVQITMAEHFGVEGRGSFYDGVGAVRDVVQNHLLQVLALLTMEPPGTGEHALDHSAAAQKVAVLEAVATLEPGDIVRGQFEGYRDEPGVAHDSQVETFAALRLKINNERWSGVPFFIRTGKHLPVTATEIVARLKPPRHRPFPGDEGRAANYFRFRLSPEVSIALGGRVKVPGEAMRGEQVELIEHHHVVDEMRPYERLLGDAMAGDASLFADYRAIEATWRIVDTAMRQPPPVAFYPPDSWGPQTSDALMADLGGWSNPKGDDDDADGQS